jgi:hypothetical protein
VAAARSPALAALVLAGAAFYPVTAAKLLWWYERPYIVTWGGRWAVGTLSVVAVLGAVALRTRRPDVRRLALAAAGAVVLVCAALVEAAIVADGRDSHPASRVVAGAYAAVAIVHAVRTGLARRPGRATALATVAASLAAVVAIWLAAELNHLFSPG